MWWGGALAESEGILYVKILSGKGLFITRRLWPSLDTVVRKVIRELENGRFDKYGLSNEAKRVFIYIREHGPVRTDLLRRALDMRSPAEGRAFHKAKNQLEGLGVLVGKAAKLEKHLHVGVLHLWTQLFPEPLPNASYERF